MEKGMKIGLIVGGLLLAGGIGVAIYAATKPKLPSAVPPANTGGGTGSYTAPTSTPPANQTTGQKITSGIDKAMQVIALIKSYTQESFPLKPGMVGPNVKILQNGLRKMNQLSVVADGAFGVKTAQALKTVGYGSDVLNGVSQIDLNQISAGVRGNG